MVVTLLSSGSCSAGWAQASFESCGSSQTCRTRAASRPSFTLGASISGGPSWTERSCAARAADDHLTLRCEGKQTYVNSLASYQKTMNPPRVFYRELKVSVQGQYKQSLLTVIEQDEQKRKYLRKFHIGSRSFGV